MQHLSSTQNRASGFTLIEIIVSLAIFSIVAVVALGALVKIIDVNKKAQTLQSSLTNLNYAIESMSRELRTGTTYTCQSNYAGIQFDPSSLGQSTSNCETANLIVFSSAKVGPGGACNLKYAYWFDTQGGQVVLKKAQQTTCSDVLASGSAPFVPIISSNITMTGYRMKMYADAPFYQYPLVSLYVTGYAGVRERERSYFELQTAISPIIP